MKKFVTIIFAIMLCLGMCACSDIDNPSDAGINSSPNNTASPNSAVIRPLIYYSLNDLKSSISQKNESKMYEKLEEDGIGKENIEKMKYFVRELQSHNITVPYLSGKVIQFRNREGFSNISLYASELYRLPWIFYHPSVSTGENFYIKIAYIPDSVLNKQRNPTASDVIKELSPGSPNIDIIGDQHKSIYNQNIRLEDREVTALVIEYKEDSRNSTIFVYDDLLIEVRSDPEVWGTQWFAALSFDGFTE